MGVRHHRREVGRKERLTAKRTDGQMERRKIFFHVGPRLAYKSPPPPLSFSLSLSTIASQLIPPSILGRGTECLSRRGEREKNSWRLF
jgi:hypothetical protein